MYCAHDSVYSEGILKQFEQETGIPVSIKFDTEATKSIGLSNLLISEKDNPRCDLFWNNQAQGTVQLQEEGVLLPYEGPGFQRIPAAFKDPTGHWTGFGSRLRVYIVNTEKMEATPEAIASRLESDDLSRVAMAKPFYGTTLSLVNRPVRWQNQPEPVPAPHVPCRHVVIPDGLPCRFPPRPPSDSAPRN